jgi:CDP-glycerol glycerophosphotransferase (TagB/SpsB family)
VCDESKSAWEHYRSGLVKINLALRRRGARVVATAHPRIAKRVQWHAERSGIEWWESEEVLNRAAVLAVDNSSFGYEFSSLDRPTVWMNAPWYRRDVHHGLRFWEAIPGEQVDEPEQVPDAVMRAMHEDSYETIRETVNAYVCPLRDGLASERAARSILSLVTSAV